MYIGSYTSEARGHGEGITVYRRQQRARSWSRVQIVKDLADPSFLTIDRQVDFFYSAHGDGTQVAAYRIDAATVRLLPAQPAGDPRHERLCICPSMAPAFPRGCKLRDRHFGRAADQRRRLARAGVGPGDDDRDARAAPDGADKFASAPLPFDPSGRVIVVPDKGVDRLFVVPARYREREAPAGDPPSVASRAGAAPRHVDFSSD
jgi:6-phosphogluconolactonase (cycloisomerase 2 family)